MIKKYIYWKSRIYTFLHTLLGSRISFLGKYCRVSYQCANNICDRISARLQEKGDSI